jgi:hypothetical protein
MSIVCQDASATEYVQYCILQRHYRLYFLSFSIKFTYTWNFSDFWKLLT